MCDVEAGLPTRNGLFNSRL